ncbi:RNA-dependent RNA polymerase [Erysiphe necator associated ambiguivirus 1]|nr:RNA-dependent RNA polymerase [Erysiphe necator associated ambiguivirus 1]
MRTVFQPGLPSTFVPVVHRSCPHNEVTALALRMMGPVPAQVFEPLPRRTLAVWATLRRFVRRYDDGCWSHQTTAESYGGALRRRYLEAARSLADEGLSTRQDHVIRAFLKSEKNRVPSKMAKPRLIFPRSPRFNLELASRLKPFEHWLWGRLNGRVFNVGDGSRLVAKGLNPRQRANLIVRKLSAIPDCVCFEIDGKSFEAHVGPASLRAEQAVYRSAFPGDRRLEWLLHAQLKLEGTVAGAKFSRDGGRASGDFNTGLGNSLIFLVECISALRELGVHFDLLVDGDNALVFVSSRDVALVRAGIGPAILASSGHEVALERGASRPEGVRFGGSAPVHLGRFGWTMVREWERVVSGATTSHKHLDQPAFALRWVKGVAMCELSLALGVPVLQEFALGLLRASSGVRKQVKAEWYGDQFFAGAWFATSDMARPVTREARLSFAAAFGVSPEEQEEMEVLLRQRFDSWNFSVEDIGFRKVEVTSFAEWMSVVGIHQSWLDACTL